MQEITAWTRTDVKDMHWDYALMRASSGVQMRGESTTNFDKLNLSVDHVKRSSVHSCTQTTFTLPACIVDERTEVICNLSSRAATAKDALFYSPVDLPMHRTDVSTDASNFQPMNGVKQHRGESFVYTWGACFTVDNFLINFNFQQLRFVALKIE